MFLYKGFGIKEIPRSQIKTIIQCQGFIYIKKTPFVICGITENSQLLPHPLEPEGYRKQQPIVFHPVLPTRDEGI